MCSFILLEYSLLLILVPYSVAKRLKSPPRWHLHKATSHCTPEDILCILPVSAVGRTVINQTGNSRRASSSTAPEYGVQKSNRSGRLPESRDTPCLARVRNPGPPGVIAMAMTIVQIFLAHNHGSHYRSGRQAQRLEPPRLLVGLYNRSPKLTRKRSSRTPARATGVSLARVPRE